MWMRAFFLSVLILAGCSSPAGRPHGPTARRKEMDDSLAGVMDSLAARPAARAIASIAFVVWDNPPIVIGRGSYLHQIAALAGARNVLADLAAPSAQVSLETIAARNPDWIAVLADSSVMPGFAKRPEWQAARAVRDRHFLLLPGSLFGRPGPRSAHAVAEHHGYVAR